MPYIFTPPAVRETPAGFGRLFMRYPIHRGDSVLIFDGVATRVRTPSVQETEAAQQCYLGGHVYEITEAERTILIANGYSDNITVE